MNVKVKGRGIEVTPAMREYAEKKVNKLEEFNPELRNAEVTCKVERNIHKVEVTLSGDGVMLRAEESRSDMYEAVDMVFEKLENQVKKHHKRQITRARGHSAREVPTGFVPTDLNTYETPPAEQAAEETDGALHPRLARVKRFFMKPMTPEEAAVQTEMLGHEFFVFRNANGGEVNVVYRRNDGSFGLIQPGDEE